MRRPARRAPTDSAEVRRVRATATGPRAARAASARRSARPPARDRLAPATGRAALAAPVPRWSSPRCPRSPCATHRGGLDLYRRDRRHHHHQRDLRRVVGRRVNILLVGVDSRTDAQATRSWTRCWPSCAAALSPRPELRHGHRRARPGRRDERVAP
ncbi:hypothetical protein HBB16_01645 [Pseudonocardia sp. MCCB 268]|nr:hypothetical protein [Pseudonocardia cytotoxica]